MRRMNALSISALVLLLASGCSSTPTSHFYTLNAAKTPTAAASKVSVAIGPVSVPAQVDRPQFVVSSGPNQVQIDEFNRWAAPLQDSITRVVAENLVAMLGSPHVTLSSQTLSADTGYRVAIEVQGFDSTPGESASLDAVWTVRRTQDGKTESGRATLREPVKEKGYDALAAAHSRAIAHMSQDIADALLKLERAPLQKTEDEAGKK
jgi:uncharacterized lipoprotein YmbA